MVPAPLRRFLILLAVVCPFVWIFSDVLLRDRNFVYRDAGHFYYPLLQLVQEEWSAGRWPLWNPYENGGMPLLGNPASAVMYPPRVVIFQWLPLSYGQAYKWYVLTHVLLCGLGSYVLARHWGASEVASGLAALSYSLGACVMFQYCNVIFLVGAAWVPWGVWAADRALRGPGHFGWAAILGIVLTMQMLGGDPESAYVTGGLAAIYVALSDFAFAALLGAGLALYGAVKAWRDAGMPLPGRAAGARAGWEFELLCITILIVASLAAWWNYRRSRRKPAVGSAALEAGWLRRRRFIALALAALIAVILSAVQWLPTWEFGRLTLRAVGGPHHEPYTFWVGPWRFVELLWPNIGGQQFPRNTRWLDVLAQEDRIWEPSLYSGAVPFVLALAACGFRRVELWKRWMTCTLVVSLWAATGPAGGPTWYARAISDQLRGVDAHRVDHEHGAGVEGRQFRDELETPGGGLYWLMVKTLPGFEGFRYPAKLLTFSALAIAVLGAAGWDRLFRDESRSVRGWIIGVWVATCSLAVLALVLRPWLVSWFARSPLAQGAPYYGPLRPEGAAWSIVIAFAATVLSLGVLLVAQRGRGRLGSVASCIALAVVAADIAVANRWIVGTAQQAALDAEPKAVQVIREAEASDPDAQGELFRVHRMSVWWPYKWLQADSLDQPAEVFQWEKDTIQPKYGVPYGISYTINEGTLETYDYWFFFAPFYRQTPPALARAMAGDGSLESVPPRVVYYPRRGYDLWNAKYFLLPQVLVPHEEHRGFAAFLPATERVYQSPENRDDFQVLRNLNYFPRAWVVHQLRILNPIRGMNRLARQDIMEQILYQGDAIWFDPERELSKVDPRRVAWIEAEPAQAAQILAYQSRANPTDDRCVITRYEPQRVELTVESSAPGVLVLADVFFPGWTLTVDGRPQEILRANRMMRGVAIGPGAHQIVFQYNPLSFRIGAAITLIGVGAITLVTLFQLWAWLRRRGSPSTA